MIGQYGLGESICNVIALIYTKLWFPRARLVRLPFRLRGGRNRMSYGEGLTLGYGCRFDLAGGGIPLRFGNNVKMNDRVHIVAHESVEIGSGVLIASNVFISDTSHGTTRLDDTGLLVPPADRVLISSPVTIGNNVWIGENACILPGVHLGDSCIVGAGAVVTKSFPACTIIAGVPAIALHSTFDTK